MSYFYIFKDILQYTPKMTQKILLSLPDAMYNKLKAELKVFSYSSVQEVVIDALHDKYFRHTQAVPGAKRGRPREMNEYDRLKILKRKKIFS